LPPLRPMDLAGYRHAVAVLGLWLAARSGTFGNTRDVLTARQMQAADATSRSGSLLGAPGAAFSNEPPQGDADAGPGYPDLGFLWPTGGWTSGELVLAAPGQERLHATIDRVSRDRLMLQQWFFVEHTRSGELIETTAAELGLADRVRIEMIDLAGIADG
jgi:hypothetical protein